jgi:hypothetical protein
MGSFSVWHWLILLLVLLPGVLYLLGLQRAMEAVDAELRPMARGLVRLLLIPLVNIVWMFLVVTHLKTGYAKMGAAGRLTAASDVSYGVRLALARLAAQGEKVDASCQAGHQEFPQACTRGGVISTRP